MRILSDSKLISVDCPDVCRQEVDHYYDFFLPELSKLGYTGYFAPKPSSSSLEVPLSADGCALFIKQDKLRVISCEAKALALKVMISYHCDNSNCISCRLYMISNLTATSCLFVFR